ncbi:MULTISPECIES: YihD family protein [Xenorhabdus]|uniref:YihD family protein n=2 Tax=Xenorhabdus TaxID=626 RepID=A0ABT5LUG5_9GAMM|nr:MULTISPECIES: YihD family protein [Xenorhabdus]MDC9590353.1 YihD family protein [Xenorhabdus yunnanensis]MDC9598048.1 YihD family protein [Xenorhabdus anantnagensis]
MKYHRLNEVIELLHPVWKNESDLNLVELLQKLADEAGFKGQLSELTDDILIYHLKMRGTDSHAEIPGLKKDYEEDFKTALLRARGIIKD